MDIIITPIGKVVSCYLDKFGTPRQPGLVSESVAYIELYPEFQPKESLDGLEEFSHLWIIFYFHQNHTSKFHAKVFPPRLKGEKKGVFATRSPHRPNNIGLSLVKLLKIEEQKIYISGIDIIDGTPVLDIKPYLPQIESVANAQSSWTTRLEEPEIDVEFSSKTIEEIKIRQDRHPEISLEKLIINTLKLDPRPTVYKGYEGSVESPYRNTHAVRIIDFDVHFEFITHNHILVFDIRDL